MHCISIHRCNYAPTGSDLSFPVHTLRYYHFVATVILLTTIDILELETNLQLGSSSGMSLSCFLAML